MGHVIESGPRDGARSMALFGNIQEVWLTSWASWRKRPAAMRGMCLQKVKRNLNVVWCFFRELCFDVHQ